MTDIKDSIVVIDDSILILHTINQILSPFYDIHIFQSQEEGIKAVGEIMPSLVMIDIILPRTSGFNVIAELKQNPQTKDIPVILMTTPRRDSKDDDEERSFMLGAVDFIPKPLKPPIVLARVRSHVRLYKYARELESITVTDALTGILNRRGFDDMLNREWGRAAREGTGISLLMIDIDHFKLYNDNYGHQSGDSTLNLVAQAIKKTLLRATDIAARYGGEEFAVILPSTDCEGACAVAENILQAVKDLKIRHDYNTAAPVITVSIGGATADRETATPADLIGAADAMLYQAKGGGRDRYCHEMKVLLN